MKKFDETSHQSTLHYKKKNTTRFANWRKKAEGLFVQSRRILTPESRDIRKKFWNGDVIRMLARERRLTRKHIACFQERLISPHC